jgi:serine/threonine-protein kinase
MERYRMERLLGEGGMGEVRLCKDLSIGREVAMKVIRPELVSHTDTRLRFLSEAQVQGQLEHPAIVPVYELGALPDGTVFFTMKRLRGHTLAEILDGLAQGHADFVSQYTRQRLLSAFATVCMAIDFSHARGVLHRDLKPQNIMLGDFGEVYVLDWGVAKLRGQQDAKTEPVHGDLLATDGSVKTVAGAVIGTLGYMSPEQAGGLGVTPDARSDVFSLGAILFEILAGEPLRERLPAQQMFLSIALGADARLSVRAKAREVPPELEQICVRATAQHPDARYPSARKLHDEVQRYLSGDRDLLLRRQLAERHVQTAEAALSAESVSLRDKKDTESARRTALREAGQALTLDPDSAAARSVLTRLFSEAPAQEPTEVTAELSAMQAARDALRMRALALAMLLSLALSPVFFLMGVRDWHGIVALWLSFAVSFVCRVLLAARPDRFPALPYLTHLLHLVSFALASRIFGPLTIITGPFILLGIVQGWTSNVRLRRFVLLTSAPLPGILYALERLGVLHPSYLFHDGGLTILPNMVTLEPTLVSIMLILFGTVPILLPGLLMGKITDQLRSGERRILLHSWNLRQILPASEPPR